MHIKKIAVLLFLISPMELFAQSDSLLFGDPKISGDALTGKVFIVPEQSNNLPKFDTMKPIATIYTKTLDISAREWTAGFPGIPDRKEWFGIVYTGKINAAKKGKYTFRLLSDDGSRLYIDKKLVVDNDGLHYPESKLGDINLSAGDHSIKLEYFQGAAPHIALQLFVSYEKESEQIFPGSNFTLSSPSDGTGFKTILIYIAAALVIILILWLLIRRKRKMPAD
jgi:hypothetical protein